MTTRPSGSGPTRQSDARDSAPERLDQMICIEQNAILQNLFEQDICFNSQDLIDQERNAMDLYDQQDSKGQMQFISSKEGLPIDRDIHLARNILNCLPVKSPAYSVAPSN